MNKNYTGSSRNEVVYNEHPAVTNRSLLTSMVESSFTNKQFTLHFFIGCKRDPVFIFIDQLQVTEGNKLSGIRSQVELIHTQGLCGTF